MKKRATLLAFICIPQILIAQSVKPIVIETSNSLLVLTVGSNQRLNQSYFGKKLPAKEYEQLRGGREVYLTAGMDNQFEPYLRMIQADGNPSLELRYVSATIEKKDNNS